MNDVENAHKKNENAVGIEWFLFFESQLKTVFTDVVMMVGFRLLRG